jgi:hypothetical protein
MIWPVGHVCKTRDADFRQDHARDQRLKEEDE